MNFCIIEGDFEEAEEGEYILDAAGTEENGNLNLWYL